MRSILFTAVSMLLFPVLAAKDFCPAGNFEGNDLKPIHIMRFEFEGPRRKKAEKGSVTERFQNEKAFSGKQSLLLESSADGLHSINLHNIRVTPGKKYEFSWRYFIAEKPANFSVSGRVTYSQKGQKPRHAFPRGSTEPGKWHQVKLLFYPPTGTEVISTTVWVGRGRYKVYLDDLKLVEFDEAKSPVTDDNTLLLREEGGVTVWKQSNYRRIDVSAVPQGLKKADRVKLTAAANEMEPFQLAVFPRKELKGVKVEFSDFKGKAGVIPASAQSFGILRYVPMRNPNNPTLKGEIADPIADEPAADAPAGKNTVFFLRIFVPKGTGAGVYKGTVTLRAGTQLIAAVPVELTVRNFELPDTPRLRTFFYGHVGHIVKRYRDARGPEAVRADLLRIFRKHRITGDQCLKPAFPPYKIENGRLIVTDWSKFDADFRELYAAGLRSFTTPYLSMMGDNSGWFPRSTRKPKIFGKDFFSQEARDLAGDFARQFHEHWQQLAPPDAQYYSYIYDEPPPKVYKRLNEFTDAVMKRAPGFRFFMPHWVDKEVRNVTVHCIGFGPGRVNPGLEKGLENWYYNWPQPLDHRNYIKNRLFAWQAFANGGQGCLKWETTSAPAGIDPWNELEKCYANGDATTIFPALKKGGDLVPTLRLAQVRESMDDVDYLFILRDKVEKKFPGLGMKYVLSRIKDLLPELPFGFTNDPGLLYKVRDRIGDEIENFDRTPAALVTSTPACYAATELSEVEIQVRGPAGADVAIGGVRAGTLDGKVFTHKITLTKFGTNGIPVTITQMGRSRTSELVFTWKRDPVLAKLEAAAKRLEAGKLDAADCRAFLKKCASGVYTAADRAKCAALLADAERTLLRNRLAAAVPGASLPVRALHDQAKWMFDNQLYGRAGYYLDLAEAFAKSALSPKSELKIVPVKLSGNFGWRISNGLIEFTLLELGGRVVSFKAHGAECFAPGALEKTLPLKVRAGKLYEKFTHRSIPALGGYEDAGLEVLPESSVDWDISVKELSDKRIALECSMLMRGGMFKISRIMSLLPGRPELKIDYTISNVFPAEFKSDDPSVYQFPWRGRLRPRIGDDAQGDAIEVPTARPLKATLFDSVKSPVFYEARSVPLTESRLGSYNARKKAGFTWKFDSSIKYAYLWFNSKGDHNGRNKLYTLEIFRSFYGNKPGVPGNTPFFIEPGKSVSFSMSFTGK